MAPNVAVNSGTPAEGGSVLPGEVVLLSDDAFVGRGVFTETLKADLVAVGVCVAVGVAVAVAVGAAVGVSAPGETLLHKSPWQHVTLHSVIPG